jgi:outer membrane protein assembly factor BamB
MRPRALLKAAVFGSLCLTLPARDARPQAPDPNVLTQHNDNHRTGVYLAETRLTPAVVRSGSFGRLYTRNVQGDIYAQPLSVRSVRTARGLKNLVLVATSKNWVYAFDADDLRTDPSAGVVWQRELRHARDLTTAEICPETRGAVGVTSTPVIDPSTGTMYVVTRRSTPAPGPIDDGLNFLHALNIADGSDRPGSPVAIAATDPTHRNVRFDARCQRNRPGLLLLNGIVYVAYATFSCDGDCPDGNRYRGWVLGYRAGDLRQVAVFCTSPTGGGAGVWQSGNGLVGEGDSVYFMTGNDTAPAPLGDSFVKLRVQAALPGLVLAGSFTPRNAATLRAGDTDLGSGGPMLLPGGRLIGGGKQGRYYVLDAASMALTQNRAEPDGFEGFQAFINTWHNDPSKPACTGPPAAGTDCFVPISRYQNDEHYGPNIHAGPVYWQGATPGFGLIYQMAEKDFLKAFRYDLATRTVEKTPFRTSTVRPLDGMPGGFSSISANRDRDGIVWTSYPEGDGQWNKVRAHLIASDALTLAVLWRDDSPISFAKFTPPTIADGRVYRATFADQLVVYGVRPGMERAATRVPSRAGGAALEPAIRRTIAQKYKDHGGPTGMLGVPTGPEAAAPTQGVRYQHYRGEAFGVHVLMASVRPAPHKDVPSCDHPPDAPPTVVESSIYWSEATGAHVVQGEIRNFWLKRGAERSQYGLPIADEDVTPDGRGRRSRFQHGELRWTPGRGVFEGPAGETPD